jgi:hypothetical protein
MSKIRIQQKFNPTPHGVLGSVILLHLRLIGPTMMTTLGQISWRLKELKEANKPPCRPKYTKTVPKMGSFPHDYSPHDNSPHDYSSHGQLAPWTARPMTARLMDSSPHGQLAPWTAMCELSMGWVSMGQVAWESGLFLVYVLLYSRAFLCTCRWTTLLLSCRAPPCYTKFDKGRAFLYQ